MYKNKRFTKSIAAIAVSAATLPLLAEDNLKVEKIVVTAQKRVESIQDVPVATSAFNDEGIREKGIIDIRDLTKTTPGVHIFSALGEAQPKLTIRGIGNSSFKLNTDNAAVIYMDEFPLSPNSAKMPQFFDLERVEILRGPQGTLYGKNSTAGAINMYTKRPTGETEGYVTATVGSFGQRDIEGAYETGLSDNWSIRFSGKKQDSDGWGRNEYLNKDINGKDSLATRVGLVYEGDDVEAYFKAWYSNSRSGGTYLKTIPLTPDPTNGAPAVDGLYSWTNNGAPVALVDDPFRLNADTDQYSTIDNFGIHANVDWTLSEEYTLSLVTGFLKSDYEALFDIDATEAQIIDIYYDMTIEEQSTELRLSSNFDGAFNYIVGMNYFTEEFTSNHLLDVATDSTQIADQSVDSIAAFVDGTYNVTDAFKLLAGLRITNDKKTYQAYLPNGSQIDDLDESWTEATYRAGFAYELDDSKNIYATYTRGYRGGQADQVWYPETATTSSNVMTDPEFVDNLEFGFKGLLWEERLQVNAALFYSKFTDMQLLVAKDFGPDNPVGSGLANAGEAEIKGFEVEGQALLSENLTVSYALTLLNAEFTQWDKAHYGEIVDFSGRTLPNAPDYKYTISPEYVWFMSEGEAFVAVDYTREDDAQRAAFYNDHQLDIQEAYSRIDARIGYRGDNFNVTLWAKNLTDEVIIQDYFEAGRHNWTEVLPEPPRSYGITVNYNFE